VSTALAETVVRLSPLIQCIVFPDLLEGLFVDAIYHHSADSLVSARIFRHLESFVGAPHSLSDVFVAAVSSLRTRDFGFDYHRMCGGASALSVKQFHSADLVLRL
jgi:hypothetical protein